MPVVGHALAGGAVAVCTRPTFPPRAVAWWAPVLIALSYVPDIASQVGLIAGATPDVRHVTHSVTFVIAFSLAAAWPIARLLGVTTRAALGITLFVTVLHVLMDMLQGTIRRPFWPVSGWVAPEACEIIPRSPLAEAVIFGALFVIIAGATWVRRIADVSRAAEEREPLAARTSRGHVMAARAVMLLTLVAAGVTHHLRRERVAQYLHVRELMTRREYAEALAAADLADRWPYPAWPGRLDYTRAEALAALGRRDDAEAFYLRSIEADPDYFWSVADLAVNYAACDRPEAWRREQAAPWVERLKTHFAGHERLEHVLAKVERKLGEARSGSEPPTRPAVPGP